MKAAAFTKTGLFEDATLEQRRRVIAFSLRYMVTHMAILEKLYSSHEYCKASNNEAAASALDAAAAYAIGSMEGVEDGGSFDGNLLFMLAKRMCVHFGTCAATNNAKVNEHIVSLFYAGQGEVEAGVSLFWSRDRKSISVFPTSEPCSHFIFFFPLQACESLMKTITEIETDLLVPLIQGMLFASLENELSIGPKIASDGLFPEGYVLSQSILPLINDASTSSAKDIENVMVGGFPNVIASSVDHQKVLLAVKNALPNMGVDCEQVGSIAGRSLCTGLLSISPASGTASTWFAASTIFASIVMTFIL